MIASAADFTDRLAEGPLDAASVAQLNTLLRDNPDARRDYIRRIHLHAALDRMAHSQEKDMSHSLRADPSPTHRPRFATIISLAAAVALAAGVAIFFLTHAAQPTPDTQAGSAATVATLTNTEHAVFADADNAPTLGSDLRSGPIQLKSGQAQIMFKSTAVVDLTAPCRFEITGPNRGRLISGSLDATVPAVAHGFTVDLPGRYHAVDLGTQFHLAVTSAAGTLLHVTQGHVRLDRDGGASVAFTQRQGAVIDAAGRVTIIPADPAADARYARRVLDLHPVVYYRMEGDSDGELIDAVGGDHAMIVRRGSTGEAWAPGRIGWSLDLRGLSHQDYAIASEYPRTTDGSITVAAWVYVDAATPWASIAKNWGNDVHGQFHFGLSPDAGDLSAYIGQAQGVQVGVREGADHPLPLHQWHHVAMVADGHTLTIYRDGKPVASAPCGPIPADFTVKALAIGAKLNNANTAAVGEWWQGRIDELAIFNQALTAAQIAQIAAAPSAGADADTSGIMHHTSLRTPGTRRQEP